jgi:hypothetical protein
VVSHSLFLPADRFSFVSTYIISQVQAGSVPSNSDLKIHKLEM